MAKYIGLMSTDARGKVGGIVMSRSRVGTTLKAKTAPKNPGSVLQRSAQSRMSGAIAMWRTLSGANQTTWAVYAASQTYTNSLGGTYSPTGLQLFTQAYINAGWFGQVPPAAFPNDYVPPPPVVLAQLTTSGVDALLTLFTATGAYDGLFFVFGARNVPPSVNYTKTLARKFLGSRLSGNEINLYGPYLLAFGGALQEGFNLPLRIVPTTSDAYISGTVFSAALEIAP